MLVFKYLLTFCCPTRIYYMCMTNKIPEYVLNINTKKVFNMRTSKYEKMNDIPPVFQV